MNQRFKYLLVLATLVLHFLLLPHPSAFAQTQIVVCEQFDVTLKINQDGSLDVSEKQDISFPSGAFTRGYREITRLRLESIDNFSIIDGEGNRYEQIQDNSNPSPYTFSVSESEANYSVHWYFPKTSDSRKSFTLSYTVHGALRIYETGDQLDWKAIFADHSYPIKAGVVVVYLPKTAQADSLQVFINDRKTDNQVKLNVDKIHHSIQYKLQSPLDAGEGLEILVQFTHGVVQSPPTAWQIGEEASVKQQGFTNEFWFIQVINWLIIWMLS